MAEAELKARATLEGGKETAQGLRDIDQAKKQVTEGEVQATQVTQEATAAQQSFNATEGDYLGILATISPRLGRYVAVIAQGVRVAGDYAAQQINVRGALRKVNVTLRKNINLFRLVAASGAVVVGVMAIVKAVQTVREEFERYTAAIKRSQSELDKIKGEEQDLQTTIEKTAETRTRVGGLTADQSRKALEDAKAISQRFEQLDKATVGQTVGMLAGLGLSREQLTDAAILAQSGRLQFDPKMGGDYMTRHLEQTRRRQEDVTATFRQRETTQGQGLGDISTTGGVRRPSEREQAAFMESRTRGGSTLNMAAVMRDLFPDMSSEDVESLVETAAKFGGSQEFEHKLGVSKNIPFSDTKLVKTGLPGLLPYSEDVDLLRGDEIEQVRALLRKVERGAGVEGPPVTVINQYHPRNYGASAGQREEARSGGEFEIIRAEG